MLTQEQDYPHDYVQFLDTFNNDEPGLVIRNDGFLEEFGNVTFQNWKGLTVKSAEIDYLKIKTKRISQATYSPQNFYFREGHTIQDLC